MTRWRDRYPIAIDFDGQELTALQLQPSKNQLAIRAGFWHPLVSQGQPGPTRDPETLLSVLLKLKKTRGFSGRRVVIHLPLDQTLCFPVDISPEKDQSLDEAILQEAEKNLPYPLEDAVIDYPSLAPTPGKNHHTATLVAARRQEVTDLLAVCKQAGLLTDALDFSPLSLIRLHHFLCKLAEKPYMVCYIGRHQSSLQVVNQDRIYAFSKFAWGSDPLVDQINSTLGFTDQGTHALDLLQKYGISGGPDQDKDEKIASVVARIITPGIEALMFEFHRILGYARTRESCHDIGQVYFYGFASMIQGLDAYVEKGLNITASLPQVQGCIKPPRNWGGMTPDRVARLCPVLGLAMRKIPWL
ncbi:MAG: pilus assembly protein PilM [Desulfobacula sp.]|jgi:type IV pilus assembly protein PilM|nr:pilus assembly protein PilM [Desulfobacula sp.]